VDEGRPRSLGIAAPGEAALFELEPEPLPTGGFRVETLFSGLSAGTELTLFKGTSPELESSFDPEWAVFRAGTPAKAFPVRVTGYMESARVVESDTPAVRPGDLVGMSYGHKTAHAAHPDRDVFVPAPAALDPVLAIYLAQMGPICANGLLHAAADVMPGARVEDLGDGVRDRRVLVVGAGVVGLLTALLAAEHGAAEVAVADPSPRRLAAAAALGLTPVDEREEPGWRFCKARWSDGRDRGADLVLQCRGQAASLQAALRAVRPRGTVIDLAFYQGGAAELRLGEEFHHNGLTLRCAQIGNLPRGSEDAWDRTRLATETAALLERRGAEIRAALITDIVPLTDAPSLIAGVAARRREVIQAVFAC
jgi:NADPH:quinone reductase-like Zn-dependent oxidoreductase